MSFKKLYFLSALSLWWCLSPTNAQELTTAEKAALKAAHQGEIVLLNELWSQQRNVPAVPVKILDDHGPQFLFSDKPEYFRNGNGIALQEEVKPGIVRLYLYHVPQPGHGPKTISAVIQNLGAEPMQFRFLRYASPAPGKDYYRIGKTGLIDFFNSKPEKTSRNIPAGGRAVIDPRLDATSVTTDELVHGFYEFEITQPARVTVFERDTNQLSVEIIDTLPKLPRDLPDKKPNGAGRGTFPVSDLKVENTNSFVLDTTNGPMRLSLADGRYDPYVTGHDSLENSDSITDSGNYGVLYRIQLQWRSGDGRGLALLMTKRGGSNQYCGAQAGAVQINAGVWPGGTVAIPTNHVFFGKPGEMVIIQKFAPVPPGKTNTIEILYSPPGASCLPTPMLFVPY